jgi:hypothetical protein
MLDGSCDFSIHACWYGKVKYSSRTRLYKFANMFQRIKNRRATHNAAKTHPASNSHKRQSLSLPALPCAAPTLTSYFILLPTSTTLFDDYFLPASSLCFSRFPPSYKTFLSTIPTSSEPASISFPHPLPLVLFALSPASVRRM